MCASDAAAQCVEIVPGGTYCPQCPGWSVCQCAYQGASCPGYDTICNAYDWVILAERGVAYDIVEEPCYWQVACYGGPNCDPVERPCAKLGSGGGVGAIQNPRDAGKCEDPH